MKWDFWNRDRAVEQRVTEYEPAFAPDAWRSPRMSGTWVSPAAVLSNSAVACRAVDLKASLLASTPLKVFRRDGEYRERVTDNALARVLARPNEDMTGFEFVELISRSLDLAGNFYARIVRTPDGEPKALYPITSGVVVERVAGSRRLRYRVTGAAGESVLLDHEVLHVKNYGTDGILGQSALQLARGSLQLEIAQNETAEKLSTDGMRIAGVISHPGKLSGEAKTRIRHDFEKTHKGPDNAGRLAVFEEGMKFIPAQFSAADSELLESRRLSAESTALIFGVHPASLGLANTSAYASAAQAALDLVSNTLNPLAARIESAVERALIPPDSDLFVEFQLDGLLRADPAGRWTSYRIARDVGAMSPNDIRKLENLPPVPGGDVYNLTSSPAADDGQSDPTSDATSQRPVNPAAQSEQVE